jgi:hypothetical protein
MQEKLSVFGEVVNVSKALQIHFPLSIVTSKSLMATLSFSLCLSLSLSADRMEGKVCRGGLRDGA